MAKFIKKPMVLAVPDHLIVYDGQCLVQVIVDMFDVVVDALLDEKLEAWPNQILSCAKKKIVHQIKADCL